MQVIVSYDLHNPGQNYQALCDALERMGGFRLLESLWHVDVHYTPEKLGALLRLALDDGDGLFITQLGSWEGWRTERSPPTG